MHDHAAWSLNCGRWAGVHVRVHMFFLLFAAFSLYLSWGSEKEAAWNPQTQIATYSLGILLVSVLLHEIGHAWAAFRLDGYVDQIVLGPLGGLESPKGLFDPKSEMLTYLAGPLVNAIICVACSLFLDTHEVVGLLHPLAPKDLILGPHYIKLAFWINWVLLLANLLPAFPFDGGRALRACINWRWPDLSARGAAVIVASLAKAVAVGIFVAAFVIDFGTPSENLVSPRFAFILLALFLFFSAKQEESYREMEEMSNDPFWGYGLSESYPDYDPTLEELEEMADLDDSSDDIFPSLYEDYEHERRLVRDYEHEEERLDEILAKVHKGGVESLSDEERTLLQRISDRYRNRNS